MDKRDHYKVVAAFAIACWMGNFVPYVLGSSLVSLGYYVHSPNFEVPRLLILAIVCACAAKTAPPKGLVVAAVLTIPLGALDEFFEAGYFQGKWPLLARLLRIEEGWVCGSILGLFAGYAAIELIAHSRGKPSKVPSWWS
jgi:hypothetical protein